MLEKLLRLNASLRILFGIAYILVSMYILFNIATYHRSIGEVFGSIVSAFNQESAK